MSGMGAPRDMRESAVLVVSELFTNAVLASCPDDDVRLELSWIDAGCQITVSDQGNRGPDVTPPSPSESLREGGRGLRVVAAVAGPVTFSRDTAGWSVATTVVPR
jgi:anti-sigma regulatory factor (Ser/Thr protein kinase)